MVPIGLGLPRKKKYAIALIPNIQRSVERWKIAYQLQTGFPPPTKDTEFQAFFQPVEFSSQNGDTFNKIKHQMQPITEVGFLDPKDFQMDSELNPNAINFIQNIPTTNSDNFCIDFLKQLITQMDN